MNQPIDVFLVVVVGRLPQRKIRSTVPITTRVHPDQKFVTVRCTTQLQNENDLKTHDKTSILNSTHTSVIRATVERKCKRMNVGHHTNEAAGSMGAVLEDCKQKWRITLVTCM